MKNIFVPTDFSKCAEKAARAAAEIAARANCDIQLVNIFSTPVDWERLTKEEEEHFPYTRQQINKRKGLLEELSKSDYFEGLQVDWTLAVNRDLKDTIAKLSESKTDDLIVMGTHGATGWRRKLMGTQTQKMIRTAHCPVLAIPTKTQNFQPKRIVFASDFVEPHNMLPTLMLVLNFAYWFGAEIYLLQIELPGMKTPFNPGVWKDLISYKFAEPRKLRIGLFDNIEEGIIKGIEKLDADMVVMETHGRTGFARFLMGSLSEYVITHSPIPVLITRFLENSKQEDEKANDENQLAM